MDRFKTQKAVANLDVDVAIFMFFKGFSFVRSTVARPSSLLQLPKGTNSRDLVVTVF